VGEPEPARLFRYHKPVGLVTTHKDPAGRPTVFDALPDGLPRLISVGRLDLNSEGLLLLTNDGGLARALEMPSSAVVRRYRARAHGRTTQEKLDTLKHGITVEGVRYGPIEAKLDKAKEGPQGANLWLTVTLHEGKNREVRRVLEALGLKVNRLIRLAYGPLALGTLGVGEIEEVGPRVVREQFAEHIEPENLPTGERPQYRVKAKVSRRGEAAAAREALESVGFDETVSDDQNRAMLWSARAEVLAGEGRYAEAAAAAHESVGIQGSMGLGHPAIKAGMILETWCALRAGDRGPAEEALARFADEPLARQSPRVSAHLALLRAMLAAPADAAAAHAASVAAARAGGAPWYLAIALAEQANAGVDRDAALAECAAILERLGAGPALERLAEPAMRRAETAAG